MKIYLSMASKDEQAVRNVMRLVEGWGHRVTLNWLDDVPDDADVLETDLAAVRQSHLLLIWGEPTLGVMAEVGAAVTAWVPIIWARTSSVLHPMIDSRLILPVSEWGVQQAIEWYDSIRTNFILGEGRVKIHPPGVGNDASKSEALASALGHK